MLPAFGGKHKELEANEPDDGDDNSDDDDEGHSLTQTPLYLNSKH